MMMENKILVELFIPNIDLSLDLYIPINKRVGNIITLVAKALVEIDENYVISKNLVLYNRYTSNRYNPNDLVARTDLRSGASLILI